MHIWQGAVPAAEYASVGIANRRAKLLLLPQVSIRFFPDEKAFQTEQDFYHTAASMPPAERSLLPQVCD